MRISDWSSDVCSSDLVHNGARWLADAIESVLAQDFGDFELILVEDASRDGSPAIMADAAARDPRVRLLRPDAHVGLPAAPNHRFAAARGALHSWTSANNLLRPAMLSPLLAELDARPAARHGPCVIHPLIHELRIADIPTPVS